MTTRIVYWTSDGAGMGEEGNPTVTKALHAWINARRDADLIVYGGDVYKHGTPENYAAFFEEMGRSVANMCATPGNHDWHTKKKDDVTGKIPAGYEGFWSSHASRQPIAAGRKGGGRYEHVITSSDDADSAWQLIFLDTGECDTCEADSPWPLKQAEERVAWLESVLAVPGRRKILFAHHSVLSLGGHGDRAGLLPLWRMLFAGGTPRVAFTLGGHDHNASVYGPRDAKLNPVPGLADGIPVLVNGAGGASHSTGRIGTRPEFHDEENYCVTRLDLGDDHAVRMQLISFGNGTPAAFAAPSLLVDRVYSLEPGREGVRDML